MTAATIETPSVVEAARTAEQAADTLTAALAETPTGAGELAEVIERLRSAVHGHHLTVEQAISRVDDLPRDAAADARDALETASIALLDAAAKLSALADEIV